MALNNGITSQKLKEAKNRIKKRHQGKVVGGINFGAIYADFECFQSLPSTASKRK